MYPCYYTFKQPQKLELKTEMFFSVPVMLKNQTLVQNTSRQKEKENSY